MPHETATGRTDSAARLISASAGSIYSAFGDGETYMEWLPPPNMMGRALEYRFEQGGRYRSAGDSGLTRDKLIAYLWPDVLVTAVRGERGPRLEV